MMFWFCLFFFFKQTTAYEMRISDWSSDVCSSEQGSFHAPEALMERPFRSDAPGDVPESGKEGRRIRRRGYPADAAVPTGGLSADSGEAASLDRGSAPRPEGENGLGRSEEHTSELQ